ncbi:MAG: helix-turn-helix domain-containing protein, partial [Acidimicrobiales bacterium]
ANVAGAVELVAEALELALEIGHDDEINRAYVNLSELLHFQSREEEAIELALEGLHYAEEHGYRNACAAMLAENMSRCLETLGRWEELDPLHDSLLTLRPLDLDVPAPTGLSVLARVMVKRGEVDRARPLLEHDRDAVLTGYYCGTVSVIISALLEMDLLEGRAVNRDLVETAFELVAHSNHRETLDVACLALRSEADATIAAGYLGDEEAVTNAMQAADRWLNAVTSRLREVNIVLLPENQLLLDQCHAEHSRAHGEQDPDTWAHISAGFEQHKRPWPTAYAKWRTAEALLLGGGRRTEELSVAAESLREAHQIGLELRAKPLVSDIESLALRARIDLGPTAIEATSEKPTEVPFGLTPREVEVLGLVAEGYSNGRIGKELFISTKTASVHVSNILRKLGASNRIEAAAIAVKAGVG